MHLCFIQNNKANKMAFDLLSFQSIKLVQWIVVGFFFGFFFLVIYVTNMYLSIFSLSNSWVKKLYYIYIIATDFFLLKRSYLAPLSNSYVLTYEEPEDNRPCEIGVNDRIIHKNKCDFSHQSMFFFDFFLSKLSNISKV